MDKREQLIEAGLELFYRQGFTATGIDRILAEAGVAKMTLYKHFGSKEGLIRAVLRRQDEIFRDWLMAYVERRAASPGDRLLALFDAHGEWFREKGFRGCIFHNAAAEFAGIAQGIDAQGREHARLVQAYIRGLVAAAGARDGDRLADWLMLLLDGAIACAQVSGEAAWSDKARAAAARLIESECGRAAALETVAS